MSLDDLTKAQNRIGDLHYVVNGATGWDAVVQTFCTKAAWRRYAARKFAQELAARGFIIGTPGKRVTLSFLGEDEVYEIVWLNGKIEAIPWHGR